MIRLGCVPSGDWALGEKMAPVAFYWGSSQRLRIVLLIQEYRRPASGIVLHTQKCTTLTESNYNTMGNSSAAGAYSGGAGGGVRQP